MYSVVVNSLCHLDWPRGCPDAGKTSLPDLVCWYVWNGPALIQETLTSVGGTVPSLEGPGGTQRRGKSNFPSSSAGCPTSPTSDLRVPGFYTFRFRLNYTTACPILQLSDKRLWDFSAPKASWDNSSNKSPLISIYLYRCYWLCFSEERWYTCLRSSHYCAFLCFGYSCNPHTRVSLNTLKR